MDAVVRGRKDVLLDDVDAVVITSRRLCLKGRISLSSFCSRQRYIVGDIRPNVLRKIRSYFQGGKK